MQALNADDEAAARRALTAWGRADQQLTRLPGGLINLTLKVTAADGGRAVLQRLHPVFGAGVNDNLAQVSATLAAAGLPTPQLLPTTAGESCLQLDGALWRLLSFIDGTSVEAVTGPALARAAGALLGRFHQALAHCTAPLPHVRPPVHEPARHLAALGLALEAGQSHRLYPKVAPLAASLIEQLDALPPWPAAPLRLVHGDPKISNLLFAADGSGLCLVDLDTLAHGPLVPELGDAFRSWCNPGPEDSAGPRFDLALFAAALAGYAQAAPDLTHEAERAAIVTGTATIFLELAVRFAADALNESYFGWNADRYPGRGEHNLARAGNQWRAAQSLLSQRAAAERVVAEVFAAN